MKERAVTAAAAVLALLAFYMLFFHKTAQVPITRPVSTETGRNGYAAVVAWLKQSGVPVASLRRRFDVLAGADSPYAPRGNLLITTMPHLLPSRTRERQVLRSWVRAGNTLLVMAALDDTPDWAQTSDDRGFLRQLARISGIAFTAGPRAASAAAAAGVRGSRDVVRPADRSARSRRGGGAPAHGLTPLRGQFPVPAHTAVEFVPVAAHPLLAGVRFLRGFSDEPSALWRAQPAGPRDGGLRLRLAIERSSGLDAVWQRTDGNGRIIVAASGSLLTNHVVAGAGAAPFLAHLVGYELGPKGTVIFDDMHQGLSVLYDPAAFFGDPRLHATLLFVAAVWLAYVLGSSNRLGSPSAPARAPRQRDFLEAVGGFMARRLDKRDAAALMFQAWFDELRRKHGLSPTAEPPWPQLRATPTLDRETLAALESEHARLESARQVDPIRLHNLIVRARKAIG
jgi:hypothetical protein